MPEPRTFKVRPFQSPRTHLKDIFRVYLSAPALLSVKLHAGDPCQLGSEDGSVHTAIAWTASDKIQDTIVQTSKTLQELYSLKLGDKITIERGERQIPDTFLVSCEELGSAEHIDDDERHHWEWLLEKKLAEVEILATGLVVDVEFPGKNRSFRIIDAGLERPRSDIFRFPHSSKVSLARAGEEASSSGLDIHLGLTEDGIGALSQQIEKVNALLRRLQPKSTISIPPYYKPSQGILVYGPKGTGKSLLINQLANCAWKKVTKLTSKDAGSIFNIAIENQPCLIIIDQIELLAPYRAQENRSVLSHSLRAGFESICNARVLVVAETRHPNEIDESLRSPERFGMEIELPVPTVKGRNEILRAIRGPCLQPSDALVNDIALKTHGYVGADLLALLRAAVEVALEHQEADSIPTLVDGSGANAETTALVHADTPAKLISDDSQAGAETFLTNGISSLDISSDTKQVGEIGKLKELTLMIKASHINMALSSVRPTAMQEVFLETPNVHWSDIGGHHDLKRRLRLAVERPLKNAQIMARLNLKPKKGLLLYGPPGCSKTLLVKALATEAGLNFLAVKGAEVVSMYVGESERAVREIFRKARAASPSIVFFDEIDAIASSRGGGKSSGGTGELNVLTTLLNEMDGFEELRNVLVVAATNKPHALDPALLRPGRLDNLIYVGPPDLEARIEILQLWLKRSQVQEQIEQPAYEVNRPDSILAAEVFASAEKRSNVVDSASSVADLAFRVAQLTEGYSGAELVSICSTAGEYAMDDERDFITWSDLRNAVQNVPRGITRDILEEYERWNQSRLLR